MMRMPTGVDPSARPGATSPGPFGSLPPRIHWRWAMVSPKTDAWFEYVGRTALVLKGPFTGQRYCFTRPGARLLVDARDQHALMAVPVLKPVLG